MNQELAEKFMHAVVLEVWERGAEELFDNYYHSDVIGHYCGQTFNFADIKNRLIYNKMRYQDRKFYLNDIIAISDSFVVARLRHTGIDIYYNKPYSADITGIYEIFEKRIKQFWLLADSVLDYYATPDDLKNLNKSPEKLIIEERDKKRFLEKLSDYRRFSKNQAVELTSREQECLYYFINGYTAKEIAKQLSLTYRTVQSYLARIKQKYGCTSKHELRQKLFPE